MTLIQPFDLQQIFVSNLAGTMQIFIVIALLVIAMLAGRFRMNNQVTLIMIALFIVFLATYVQDFYFLVILLAGMAIFYGIGRIIKY